MDRFSSASANTSHKAIPAAAPDYGVTHRGNVDCGTVLHAAAAFNNDLAEISPQAGAWTYVATRTDDNVANQRSLRVNEAAGMDHWPDPLKFITGHNRRPLSSRGGQARRTFNPSR